MVLAPASRLLLALVIAACALLALPQASKAAAKRLRQADCVNAGLEPAPGNLAAVRAAVLCLHNRERALRGLPRLKESSRLRRAAARHSGQMVADGFFGHDSPAGDGVVERVLRTGYAGDGGWTLGENIAWGTSDLATPAEIQSSWMRSPAHRANILRREFREVGIGVALGTPDGADGATFTADFGARR